MEKPNPIISLAYEDQLKCLLMDDVLQVCSIDTDEDLVRGQATDVCFCKLWAS
jgi:hypothetical protein